MNKSLLILVLVNIIITQARLQVKRQDYAQMLKNARSLEDFQRLADIVKNIKPEIIQIPDEENEKRVLIPEGQQPNTTHLNYTVDPPLALCMPRPVVVQIAPDDLPDLFLYPTHVILHRCAGTFYSAFNQFQCLPTAQTKFAVNIDNMDPIHHRIYQVQVVSHTSCGAACRIKQSDCKSNIQVYDPDWCTCDCLRDELDKKCNHTMHTSDYIDCRCYCNNYTPKTCVTEGVNKVFNHETCKCDLCSKRVINRCIRKNMTLNKEKCKCE